MTILLMTPLQKGQFTESIVQKWGDVVKKYIKKPQNEPKNAENVMQVGGNPVQFQKFE
jgi:hypothetical protein